MILYPASSLHRVTPVTRGERRASFFWIQSMIRDDAARTFTAVRRRRAWTYRVTDKTRFVVDGAESSWWDVRVGSVVQVRWHRAGNDRVADVVGIRQRRQ